MLFQHNNPRFLLDFLTISQQPLRLDSTSRTMGDESRDFRQGLSYWEGGALLAKVGRLFFSLPVATPNKWL